MRGFRPAHFFGFDKTPQPIRGRVKTDLLEQTLVARRGEIDLHGPDLAITLDHAG
jgi:hypothetical protein